MSLPGATWRQSLRSETGDFKFFQVFRLGRVTFKYGAASTKFKIRDQDKLYFVTFSIVAWVDVFSRGMYRNMVVDSLRFCQKHKGLAVYASCLMTNPIHLVIGQNGGEKMAGIIRDIKKKYSC